MRGYSIEHPCPQCGGPVVLEETDRVFSCGYCRVRLYISPRGLPRYVIPPSSTGEEITFVPYWRFRGMHFSILESDLKARVLDASFIASGKQDFLPSNLGVRAQALRLRFADPETQGARFLETGSTLDDALDKVRCLSGLVEALACTEEVLHRSFVGECVSLIYSPIYVKGRGIYDAVVGRPVASYTSLREDCLNRVDGSGDWKASFLPALCPACGWDLDGGRESVVLFCRNCESAWRAGARGFEPRKFRLVPSDRNDAVHIPFWKISAEVQGLRASSYADLVRLANLPKAPRPQWEDRALYFWSPAFNAAPRLFLRLARMFTALQPVDEGTVRLARARLMPVTLASEDAASALKVTLAALSTNKNKTLPLFSDVSVEMKGAEIIYLPFIECAHDYVNESSGFSIQRNALRDKAA